MKMLTKTILLAAGAALFSLPANAGQVQPANVDIDLDVMFGSGDMVTARTALGDDVFIGCGTRNMLDGGGGIFSWGFCQGRDAEGDQATCFTFDPALVEKINAINDSSYIQFGWQDDGFGGLECNRIGLSTQSFYLGNEVKREGSNKDKGK